MNGRGADYESLEAICKESGLILICDSAEALGSKSQNRYLGTFGNAGCFSFSANKTISSGQGGQNKKRKSLSQIPLGESEPI